MHPSVNSLSAFPPEIAQANTCVPPNVPTESLVRLRPMPRGVLVAVCLLGTASGAAIQPFAIIPRPAVIRHLNGTFQLDRPAAIYADPAARPIAQWFAEQLHSEFDIAASL